MGALCRCGRLGGRGGGRRGSRRPRGRRGKLRAALRWHLAWADKEAWLRELEAEEGEIPRALLEKPEIPLHLGFVWRAFWDLNGDRAVGLGGAGPIPFTAIDRYAERFGIVGAEAFERFVLPIRGTDGEVLNVRRASEVGP
jgi:hypothetical protein